MIIYIKLPFGDTHGHFGELMKKIILVMLVVTSFSTTVIAAINTNSSCPDLAGTYQTADGATFSMASAQQADGTVVIGYGNDVWIADGKFRDSHTGTLNPQSCPSQIICQNKLLIRSYTCYGIKSTEVYSLINGNIKVIGNGMGMNGTYIYTRIGN